MSALHPPYPGVMVVLEGVEGCGKSTQIKRLEKLFSAPGRKVHCLRDPGGTPLAEQLRGLLREPRADEKVEPLCELLLFWAARVQLLKGVIVPALENGDVVLCDRFELSTRAYQGGGRGLTDEQLETLHTLVMGDFAPDLTVVLDLPVAAGLSRARARGRADRFEREGEAFFEQVRAAYLTAAAAHPGEICVVNADAPEEEVTAQIAAKLKAHLGARLGLV